MRQTVTIRRIETKTISLEVIQPLSKETLGAIVNGQAQGIGLPGAESETAHGIGAWTVVAAKPECECGSASRVASGAASRVSKKGRS